MIEPLFNEIGHFVDYVITCIEEHPVFLGKTVIYMLDLLMNKTDLISYEAFHYSKIMNLIVDMLENDMLVS